MKETFEDYLKYVHGSEYIGLDDDMPESFETFISNLDVECFLMHADMYATRVHNNALKMVEDALPTDRNGYGIDRAEIINNIQKLKI